MADRQARDPVADYFTDREELRAEFERVRVAPALSKRLFVLQGMGGVGKSSLVRMFRLSCVEAGTPVGLVAGDESLTAVDMLVRWSEELAQGQRALQPFSKELERYLAIQAKAQSKATREFGSASRVVDLGVRVTSRTADSVASATAGAAIGSLVPLVGPVAGAVGGVAVETSVDWLRSFLSRPDADLVLEPSRFLARAFLESIAKHARRERIVLIGDGLDRMATLQPWLGLLVKELHPNVLVVVAGRDLPPWDQVWDGWRSEAAIHHQEPMTSDVTRDLIRNYSRAQVGTIPDDAQVERIAKFAQGLPLAVTTAVRLLVTYNVNDFGQIEGDALAKLAEAILSGVQRDMIPLLRAAAVLRYFDREMIRDVSGVEAVDEAFEDLRQFPFMRPGTTGTSWVYRVHDSVREVLHRSLRVDHPRTYHQLHGRAAAHFGERANHPSHLPGLSDEWQRLAVEQVYHAVRSAEPSRLELVHTVFHKALQNLRYDTCRAIIDDLRTLEPPDDVIAYRVDYYSLRLLAHESSWAFMDEAALRKLVAESEIDPALRWEVHWTYAGYLNFVARPAEGRMYLVSSLDALTAAGQRDTSAGCQILLTLAGLHRDLLGGTSIEAAQSAVREAADISSRIGDPYSTLSALLELGQMQYAVDDYDGALDAWGRGLQIARSMRNAERTADMLNRHALGLIAESRLPEAQRTLDEAMVVAGSLPDTLGGRRDKEMYIRRHYGLLYLATGDLAAATDILEQSANTYRARQSTNGLFRTLVLLAESQYQEGSHEKVEGLVEEIREVASRTSLAGWVARWRVLEANRMVDSWIASRGELGPAIATYLEALVIALRWNPWTVDQVGAQIVVKIGSIADGAGVEPASEVLATLRARWKAARLAGRPLADVRRDALLGDMPGFGNVTGDSDFLDNRKGLSAIRHPRRFPRPWDGL